jgi:hypothetical protein
MQEINILTLNWEIEIIDIIKDLEKNLNNFFDSNKYTQVIIVNKLANTIIEEKIKEKIIESIPQNSKETKHLNKLADYEYYIEEGDEKNPKCILIDKTLYEYLKKWPTGFWNNIKKINIENENNKKYQKAL